MSAPTFLCAPSLPTHSGRPHSVGHLHRLRRPRRARHPVFTRCARCISPSPDDPRIANCADVIPDNGVNSSHSTSGIDAASMGIAVPVDTAARDEDATTTNGAVRIDALTDLFRRAAFPAGFPSTVGAGYVHFAVCNVLRQVFRTAYYVLGTSSLLVALSVDTGTSLTLSSALTWALKDGLGLAAKAGLSSTFGPSADTDPKRARLAGEALMVLSGATEACSVLRPSAFLPLAALAGVLRQAGDSLSGPSYRVFLDSLAVSSNIGDVSARAEAQVVTGKLLGLGLGAIVVAGLAAVPPDPSVRLPATGAAFAVLAMCHLATARVQVSTIALRTLNVQRLHLVLDTFLATACVPSVRDVNNRERVVYSSRFAPHPGARGIMFGTALRTVVADGEECVPVTARYLLAVKDSVISVALREDMRPEDLLLSSLHARRLLQVRDGGKFDSGAVQTSGKWARESFDDLRYKLEMEGWDISRLLLPVGKARFRVLNEMRACTDESATAK